MCSWHQVCAPAQGQPAEPRNAHTEAGLICTWVPGPVLCRPVHAPPGAPGQLSLVERLVLDPVAPEACTPGQGKEEARGSTRSARRQRLHPPRVKGSSIPPSTLPRNSKRNQSQRSTPGRLSKELGGARRLPGGAESAQNHRVRGRQKGRCSRALKAQRRADTLRGPGAAGA